MLMTSPLLDTIPDEKDRTRDSWTNSITSVSFLLRLCDIVDSFAQVPAQGDVSTRKTTIIGLTPTTIYTLSSNGRLLGFLPHRTGIAPVFHCDAIVVGPRPLVPQTPSHSSLEQL